MTDRATTFAAVYALLRTSADLGDHVIQTDGQATTKGQHDGVDGGSTRTGRRACTAHCLSLGVAPSAGPESPAIAQFSGMGPWTVGARQVSQTEAVAR